MVSELLRTSSTSSTTSLALSPAASAPVALPLPLRRALVEASAVDLADLRTDMLEIEQMARTAMNELKQEKGGKYFEVKMLIFVPRE